MCLAESKENVLYEGCLVAHCTLRLLNPECHLTSDWSAEPLHLQSSRAVTLVYSDSVSPSSSSSSSSSSQQAGVSGLLSAQQAGVSGLLPAPTLSYCFPLLRAVVTSHKKSEQGESLLVKCLDLLSTHAAKLCSDDPRDEVDLSAVIYIRQRKTYLFLPMSLSVCLSVCLLAR